MYPVLQQDARSPSRDGARRLSGGGAPPARRGGFMDPGGVAEAELRNVDPVPVDSERTLRTELDKIGSSLALAVRSMPRRACAHGVPRAVRTGGLGKAHPGNAAF